MTFGDNLQSLRESKELSQKELAGLIGVSTGIVAEWEADEATPNLAELSRLSKALGVSSDVLLDATDETTVIPSVQPAQKETLVVIPAKKCEKTGRIIGALVLCVVLLATGFVLWKQAFFEREFAKNTAKIEIADTSVVTIFCYDYEGELAATGSGFVAFDGKTIITNYHVMTSAYTCKISTNQDISYEVSKILCYSKDQDIAILQLAKDTGLQPLTLGDSSIIKKGETVVAIGSPLGIKNTVSTGNLSGRLMDTNMDVLQFTAPISSGSSGGALFDNNGNVIGITFASIIDGQSLNLAIPIELAVKLYASRGAAKSVSAICVEEYPYVAFLEKNRNIPEDTLIDLKNNPEKYDGKSVKLTAYVSSFSIDDYLYLSDRDNVSGDMRYDWAIHISGLNFEDMHILPCLSWDECYGAQEIVDIGNQITVIGEFVYEAIGEKYPWGESVRDNSSAFIRVKYVF